MYTAILSEKPQQRNTLQRHRPLFQYFAPYAFRDGQPGIVVAAIYFQVNSCCLIVQITAQQIRNNFHNAIRLQQIGHLFLQHLCRFLLYMPHFFKSRRQSGLQLYQIPLPIRFICKQKFFQKSRSGQPPQRRTLCHGSMDTIQTIQTYNSILLRQCIFFSHIDFPSL